MNQPTISVIVPVYNGCEYLNNLFGQFSHQLSDDFEMVLVDDGSSDDTYQTMLEWKDKVRFSVIVHHQENQGVSAARNQGMQLATGKYITFVDVDDVVSNNYLQILLECAQKGLDVAIFASERITDPCWSLSETQKEKAVWMEVKREEQLETFLKDPTRLGVYNLLVRREYLIVNKIQFTIGYKYYEDYDFLLQLFAQTELMLRTDDVLYYYLMQEGSAMGRFNVERLTCLQLMKERAVWLEQKVPQFAEMFHKWGTARLYWSVLWQAALALPVYREFKEFIRITHAKKYLGKLFQFPDWTVQISSLVFMITPRGYWTAMRILGGRRSKVSPVNFEQLVKELELRDNLWMEE